MAELTNQSDVTIYTSLKKTDITKNFKLLQK